jgi:membrane associated rhomboid family serine protease
VIPLKDTTPRRSIPFITLLLIAANIAVFVHQVTLPPRASEAFIRAHALTPYKVEMALQGRHLNLAQSLLPLFTSMFLHGGFLHILGNMWFLWIFGANVEDRMGHAEYLFFYTVCGLGSGISQLLFSWGSHVPSLGASGAISGVLGAYIVFFPGSRILSLVPLFIIWFMARIPAMVFIGLWFLAQFLSGIGSLGESGAANTGGVAWWAHIGGFLLGVFLARGTRGGRRPAASYG